LHIKMGIVSKKIRRGFKWHIYVFEGRMI